MTATEAGQTVVIMVPKFSGQLLVGLGDGEEEEAEKGLWLAELFHAVSLQYRES